MFIVGLDLENADFYIQRNGSVQTCGKPTKENPGKGHFGVYVDRAVLLPDFFFYFAQYCHQAGAFGAYAHGSLNLKHLRVGDVRGVLRAQMEALWGQKNKVETATEKAEKVSVSCSV